jgi:hypothetical protein
VEDPPGWQVAIEKEEKPDQIYSQETGERAKRGQEAEGGAPSAKASAGGKEDELLAKGCCKTPILQVPSVGPVISC